MKRNSLLLVVVFISTAQLALTLLAVAWLFSWFDNESRQLTQQQIIDVDRAICDLAAGRIDAMGLKEVEPGTESWQQLQEYIETAEMPNEGFLSVVESSEGKILCHPRISHDSTLIGKTWDEFLSCPSGKPLIKQILGSPLQKDSVAIVEFGDSIHAVHGQTVPGIDIVVLKHQNLSATHAFNSTFLSSQRGTSFAFVLALGLLATVLNIFVIKRITNADCRVQDKLEQLIDDRTDVLDVTKNAIIFGLAKLAESRDNDTGQHLDRIRRYVTILATDLANTYDEIDTEFIKNLGVASSLHDIGKVGIPDSILLKPGRLTSLERSIMEKHAIIGGECLEAIGRKLGDNDFLEMAREVAFWHHEHWDGCGYPHKLSDEQIPISARIVAVADVYDALTSRRPYKRAMTHTESRAIVVSGSGQMFDPEVVAAFLRHESEFQKVARRYQNVNYEEPNPEELPSLPLLEQNTDSLNATVQDTTAQV